MLDDPRNFPLPDARPSVLAAQEARLFALDPSAVELPGDPRHEPLLDQGPVMVGFDAPEEDAAAETVPLPATPGQRTSAAGIAGALGVHLLPLLLLVSWNFAPARLDQAIPITLVLEEPSPPPQPEPTPPPKPAGRLASIDIGDPTAKAAKGGDAPPPEPTPDQTKEAAAPSPKRAPRPALVSALPKPAAGPKAARIPPPPDLPSVQDEPEPDPPLPEPPVKHAAAPHPSANAHLHPVAGRIPGPAATRDEYLAYANGLIRHYQEMIPHSMLAGRNGIAVISILVLADGSIARIAVKQSSGYPEIDQRAERMVAAVRRFPPLPQWFTGTSIVLNYHMLFGNQMVLP